MDEAILKSEGMQTTKGRYWHFFDTGAPGESSEIRLWVALPPNHRGQDVINGDIHPRPVEIIEENLAGNRIIYWQLNDFSDSDMTFCYYDFQFGRETVLIDIDPEQVGQYDFQSEEYRRYTRSEPWIEITDEIKLKSKQIVQGEQNPYKQALLIFDWILEQMVYEYPDVENRGAAKSFTSLKGDCGEFSFVFSAMCRSLGIPARTITCNWLTEAGHNWAEILLPGYGWVPVDLSMAQALDGKSQAFQDEIGFKTFAESIGILEFDPYWLFGNLYSERLIVNVGNNLEVNHPASGISKTFIFLQPGGSLAVPPALEADGFETQPVEAGFFLFGDRSDDLEYAQQVALKEMVSGYLSAGNYEMAEKGIQKKLEEMPDSAQTLLDLGQCYLNQERFDEAIDAFERSLLGKGGSIKPVLDVWAHNLSGVCYLSKGEVEKAKKEFHWVIDSGIDFQNSQQFAREQLSNCE